MLMNPTLKLTCTRFVSGHPPQTAQQWLARLAQSPLADLPLDRYGVGPAIGRLEQEVAALLGKEAAVFLHKGVIAQQMALRVWTDRTQRRTVALHPQSHIYLDERQAYERLHPLVGVPVGTDWTPFTVQDLAALHEPLGVITVELPLRNAGFKLLPWSELAAIADWARAQGVPLHLDGARLWEAAPYYDRPLAEIAALADSVYVSFYKGLGGLAGCILAGPADFIAECHVWQTRLGGNLYILFPYVLAAYDGLQQHWPKMAGYWHRAQEVAAALVQALPVHVAPDPPQTNAFQLFVPGTAAAFVQAAETLARRDQVWLAESFTDTAVPGLAMAEIQIGAAAEAWTTAELVRAFAHLLDLAASDE